MKYVNEHSNRTRFLTFRDKEATLDSAYDHIKILDFLLNNEIDKAIVSLKKHVDKSQLYFIKNFNFKG